MSQEHYASVAWEAVCQASSVIDSPDFYIRFGQKVDHISQYRYLVGTTGLEVHTTAHTRLTERAEAHFFPNGRDDVSPPSTQIERSINALKLMAAFIIMFRDLNTPGSKLKKTQWLCGITGNQFLVNTLGIRLCAFTEIVSSKGFYCSYPDFIQKEDVNEFSNFSYRVNLLRFGKGLNAVAKLSETLQRGLDRFGDRVPITNFHFQQDV